MAQLALTFGGSLIPGVGPLGAFVGGALGGYIDRKVLFPSDKKRPGPSLDAIQIQTADEGVAIPIVFGTAKIAGNVIWVGRIDKRKVGDDYKYFCTFAVGLCLGPVDRIISLYADEKNIITYDDYDPLDNLWGRDGWFEGITYRAYLGTEDQQPDPLIVHYEGATLAPAFRGLCYVVFEDFPLEWTGNAIPTITAVIAQSSVAYTNYTAIDIGTYMNQIWSTTVGDQVRGAIEITDIDGDGHNELVFATYNGNVYTMSRTGSLLHVYNPGGSGSHSIGAVCCVDVDDDGYKEIIIGNHDGWMRCLSYDLQTVKWTVQNYYQRHGYTVPQASDKQFPNAPTAAYRDVGGVSTLCIFIAGKDGVLTCVRASNGAVIWELNTNVGNPLTENHDFTSPPAIKDFDLDGQPEIVVVDNKGNAWGTNDTGGIPQTPPPDDPGIFLFEGGLGITCDTPMGGVAIADVNADGWDEIILTGGHYIEGTGNRPHVWLLDHEGTCLDVLNLNGEGSTCYGRPVVVDADEDDKVEIFFSDSGGQVTCLTVGNGNALTVKWISRVSAQQQITSGVCLLDVDGDGKKEVLVCPNDGYLVVLKADTGAESQRLMLPGASTVEACPTGGDIDEDGYVEILVPTIGPHQVVCFRAAATSPGNWFRREGVDSGRTGFMVLDVDPDGGTHKERDAALQDNIVLSQEQWKDHVYIETGGVWNSYYMAESRVDLTVDHRLAGVQQIPFAGCDFDVDEDDNIYTTRTSPGGYGALCKLDPETFAVLDDTLDNALFFNPTQVRASKNREFPWVAMICNNGQQVYLFDRRTLRWGGSDCYTVNPANSNYHFTSVCMGPGGLIWLLEKRDDNGWCKLRLLNVTQDYVVTPQSWDAAPGLYHGTVVTVDEATHQVLVGTRNRDNTTPPTGEKVAFYSFQLVDGPTYSLTHLADVYDYSVPGHPKSAWQAGANAEGVLRYAYGTEAVRGLNLNTHTVEDAVIVSPPPGAWSGGSVQHARGKIIAGCSGLGFSYALLEWDRLRAVLTPVSGLVQDIADYCGFALPDLDVSALDADLWGYVLNNRMSGLDALRPLMEAFFFDLVGTGDKLTVVPRGGSSVVTIPREHLASHQSEEARPQEMEVVRTPIFELPTAVEVVYGSYDHGYAQKVQRATRQNLPTNEVLSMSVPMILSDDAALQIAYKALGLAWLSQNQRKLTVPREYAYLTPADLVTVECEDGDILVRIDGMTVRGGLVDMDVTEDDPEVYRSEVEANRAPAEEVPTASGGTFLAIIDGPLRSSLDDVSGVYVAMSGYATRWPGAVAYLSKDGGGSWAQWLSSDRRSTVGRATTVLAGCPDTGVCDRAGSIQVRLLAGDMTLEPATEAELQAGANMAVLGNEVIQFLDVEEMADGTLLLSGLVRGMRGTEWAVGTHAVGEVFALLADLVFQPVALEDRTAEQQLQAVTYGYFLADKGKKTLTPMMRNLSPLAPAHVRGARNGDGDLTITWVRRARYAGEWLDYADVPLCEASELYEIEILLMSVVVRTLTALTSTCTYTAAQQTADGFTPGVDPVDVVVYQKSATVGRGWPAVATV